MSLGQRLAWIEGFSTLAVLGAAIVLSLPAAPDGGSLWPVVLRVVIIVGVCLASLYYNDLYDFEVAHDFGAVFARLCRALGLAALILAATYLFFPGMMITGNLASQALVITLVAILGIRVAAYGLAKRAPFTQRALILGNGSLADSLVEHIQTRPDLALTLVGVLPEPGGGGGDVGDVVRRLRADRIIVALPDRRGTLPVAQLLACRVRGVCIEEGTQAYERITRRLAVESLTPSALIFGDGFHVSRTQLALKRAVSVVLAGVGLLFAAPFMGVVALIIKLESAGPAFFIQERVGLHGKIFRLIKFRTMHVADEVTAAVWERDNRSRVTRVGAILRKYRLDELPQCINILRGDMSLVGPRPEMASNVATFSAVIPYYNLRHEVRPGLTGWAQIRAGYSMSTEEVTRKLCYDLYYIKHMSLRFDLRILFDTVKFVFSGKRPG
jgi:exopolysaccharide biosynthesis polyprenyl glycosylphosphotransferase